VFVRCSRVLHFSERKRVHICGCTCSSLGRSPYIMVFLAVSYNFKKHVDISRFGCPKSRFFQSVCQMSLCFVGILERFGRFHRKWHFSRWEFGHMKKSKFVSSKISKLP
jgi:hypothetical protein